MQNIILVDVIGNKHTIQDLHFALKHTLQVVSQGHWPQGHAVSATLRTNAINAAVSLSRERKTRLAEMFSNGVYCFRHRDEMDELG